MHFNPVGGNGGAGMSSGGFDGGAGVISGGFGGMTLGSSRKRQSEHQQSAFGIGGGASRAWSSAARRRGWSYPSCSYRLVMMLRGSPSPCGMRPRSMPYSRSPGGAVGTPARIVLPRLPSQSSRAAATCFAIAVRLVWSVCSWVFSHVAVVGRRMFRMCASPGCVHIQYI